MHIYEPGEILCDDQLEEAASEFLRPDDREGVGAILWPLGVAFVGVVGFALFAALS